jgi:phosphopantothenate---cysteine ligase (CTP)
VRCIVAAGPTWEPVDQVRRLTNFSTGELGGRLANALAAEGHDTTLFLGESATWNAPVAAVRVQRFNTTQSLADLWRSGAGDQPAAVFQVAAVSDFTAGGLYRRTPAGALEPLTSGKASTREGDLWLALKPTPKVLPQLRGWYPKALIVGWKFEVEGVRTDVEAAARRQFNESANDYCVMNGPAYGAGFGLMAAAGEIREYPDRAALLEALAALVARIATGP